MRKVCSIFVISILLLFIFYKDSPATAMRDYCAIPPFVTLNPPKTNVLIIFDNSNSMDEDFYGNAVGSYSPASKSVVGKKALRDIVERFKDKFRMGLITYKVSGVRAYHIHNSPYFVSYEPKSYCPNPPSECVEYCQTGNATAKSICESQCKADNPSFDVNYFDEIITNYSIGSEQRNRYCSLVYPKTQRMVNPTDPSHYMYYKHAYPMYSSSNLADAFCYSTGYNPNEGSPYDSYSCYHTKTGTSDDYNGYSNYWFDALFVPTDTDYALGYDDFGRRLSWYHVGQTWFSNRSPGDGYLHVPVGDLVDSNGDTTSTYTNLMNKLDPKENDESGYMSCHNSNKNTCPYIINAGLTPTAGTLQTAIDYLNGEDTPIQYWCQKTFIVYVTDGLPSVDENGNPKTADELMPDVLAKLDTLKNYRCSNDPSKLCTTDEDCSGGGKCVPYKVCSNNLSQSCTKDEDCPSGGYCVSSPHNIKTYILGVGLSDEAKPKLDEMAVHGGTDVNGHAYYADNPDELTEALSTIFTDILRRTSSGTSCSILSEKTKEGASILQAVFYPQKQFGDETVDWVGYLYDYWLYNSDIATNIREDNIENKALDVCTNGSPGGDYILDFYFEESRALKIDAYKSNCNGTEGNKVITYSSIDGIHPVWEAGEKLKNNLTTNRKIYTIISNLEPSAPANLVELKDITCSKIFGDEDEDGTIDEEDEGTKLISKSISFSDLKNFIYGEDISGYRERKIDNTHTWKLGDIIYSTPKIINYDDYSVVYIGANDGMLHAFKLGRMRYDNLNPYQIVKICNDGSDPCEINKIGEEIWAFIPKNTLPYLRTLTDSDYCHMYFVDLTPYIVELDTDNDGKVDKYILIGGMRFGGAVGCSGTNCVGPIADTCPDPSDYNPANNNCIGLSSYFALDVTDPENPKFLWEFGDPDLGFTYSGPAFIKRNNNYYVMFVSGPTNYSGESGQDLKVFVLKLKNNFTIDSTTELTPFSCFKNAFGGRLFTNGIDYDGDGNTDMVFFGVSYKTGNNWQGNIVGVKTNSDNPAEWEFIKVFNSALKPITAKVGYAKCFDMHYIYFGTGRYFFNGDEPGKNENDKERIYGVRIDGCLDGTANCNISAAHSSDEVCNKLHNNVKVVSWYQELNPKEDSYYKERMITDPTVTDYNVTFFTTVEPTADVCGFGGRSRMWGLNCATGESLLYQDCSGYITDEIKGTLFLQLSGGNIEEMNMDIVPNNEEESNTPFTEEDNKATSWKIGIPPESTTPFVPPPSGHSGKILFWVEK